MAAVDSGTLSSLESTTAAGVTRPPPLTQTDAITSLLSLSLAAAAAGGDPSPGSIPTTTTGVSPIPIASAGSVSSPMTVSSSLPKTGPAGKHHRRLASTGQTKRRLSDAREAGVRPVLALPVAAAASSSPANANPTLASSTALSLAALSLSTSPPSSNAQLPQSLGSGGLAMGAIGHGHSHSYSSTFGYSPLAPKPSTATTGETKTAAVPITISTRHKSTSSVSGSVTSTTPAASTSANGKKKRGGIDYICESCAKVYRHPNCLNKHRWEHTAQWREASKFVLSKHQQVQLLEAATILSHMAEGSSKAMSLPEDRSEWPSYLSGGRLPKVGALADEEEEQNMEYQQHNAGIVIGSNANVNGTMPPFGSIGRAHANNGNLTTRTYALQPHPVTVNSQAGNGHAISASVPSTQGPKMYDYAGVAVARATHVAPGLVGVPNTSSNARKSQVPRNYSGSGSSASRSRSRSGSASASNSNNSDVEINGDEVDIEVDVVGEDVDEDEVDGMSLDGDGEENVGKQKTTSAPAASAAFTYSPYYSTSQQTALGVGQSPGGYTFGSYGSYGSGFAGTPSSASYGGAGFSSSFSRRGGSMGLGMKREDDEMSIGFSVREEDEEEEEGHDMEQEAEDDSAGGTAASKKLGPVSSLRGTSAATTSMRSMSTRRSTRTRTLTEKARGRTVVEERKWDGMEMEVDNMDMD